MASLSRREARLVRSWVWLHQHEKTPVDLGISWGEVDPWWQDAMDRVSAGYGRAMKSATKAR